MIRLAGRNEEAAPEAMLSVFAEASDATDATIGTGEVTR